MNLDGFVSQYAGTIITVGGSIGVAFITAMGLVWAKGRTPAREPVPIQDVWEENRQVVRDYRQARADLAALEEKFDTEVASLKREFRNYREGKDAEVKITRQAVEILWNYVERIKLAWGSDLMPVLTAAERSVLNQVIEDVATPPAGLPIVST